MKRTLMASLRNAPLFLLPLLGFTSAVPTGSLITTTSLLVPREVPNYGSCKDPTIQLVPAVGAGSIMFQPANWDHFRKEIGIHTDFYFIARFICAKLKGGCGPNVPAETVQTCWDSYGRASVLNPEGTEQAKWQQRVDKFNRGIRGEDGISPLPNPGPTPPQSDHYEVEIWAGPSTVKYYPDEATPNMYIDKISNLFAIKPNGDFNTTNDQKFAGGCTISTKGYTDKYANGDALTRAMKKLMLAIMDTDLIVRHGSERTAVKCNGWIDSDGSCCFTNKKDPATGKCPDGFIYKTFKTMTIPNEFSMRATMTPNNGRGNGYMKWNIDCGKSGLANNVWKKDCQWCADMKMGFGDFRLGALQQYFTQNLGGMQSTIMMDCNSIPCK